MEPLDTASPDTASPDSEWTPVDDCGVCVDLAELDDLDLVDELTHRVRGPLLRRLRTPRSAAELAEDLGVPVTRLYHHLNVLEGAGLIRVVATRRVGAATERRYGAIARGFRVRPDLVDNPAAFARSAGVVVDAARDELMESVECGTCAADEVALWSVRMPLDREALSELVERLGALITEFHDRGRASGATDEVQVLAVAFSV